MSDLAKKLKNLLDDSIIIDGKEINIGQALLGSLTERALKGDTKAIGIIFDRLFGKPTQSLEIGAKDGNAPYFDQARALQEANTRIIDLIGEPEDNGIKISSTD